MSWCSRRFKNSKKKVLSLDRSVTSRHETRINMRTKPSAGIRRGIRRKKEQARRAADAKREADQRLKHFIAAEKLRRVMNQRVDQTRNLIPEDKAGRMILLACGGNVRLDHLVTHTAFQRLDVVWNLKYANWLPFPRPPTYEELHSLLSKALLRKDDLLWQWISQESETHNLFLSEDEQRLVPEYVWRHFGRTVQLSFGVTLPDFNPIRSLTIGDLYKALKAVMNEKMALVA